MRSGQVAVKTAVALAEITDDLDVLLAFYDYPAGHWVHLRTTNPIESTFATVRLLQRITRGPGSRAAGIAMAVKLIESAQTKPTHRTSSHSSAPAPPSTEANSSNAQKSQAMISWSRDTPIHRP